jgi:hypothetical protein
VTRVDNGKILHAVILNAVFTLESMIMHWSTVNILLLAINVFVIIILIIDWKYLYNKLCQVAFVIIILIIDWKYLYNQ